MTTPTPNYVNPIGSGLTPERIDQGVDYGGSGNLMALGSGVITSTKNAGWPGGGFIGLHLDTGNYVFYAEDVSANVNIGQKVQAGQVIGRATGGPSGIEVGWAAPPGTGNTMAMQAGQTAAGLAHGDPGFYPTAYGVDFSKLIQALGGPPGKITGPIQGTVPAGFDTASGNASGTSSSTSASGSLPCGLFSPQNCVINAVTGWTTDFWRVPLQIAEAAFGGLGLKELIQRAGLIVMGAIIIMVGVIVLVKPSNIAEVAGMIAAPEAAPAIAAEHEARTNAEKQRKVSQKSQERNSE